MHIFIEPCLTNMNAMEIKLLLFLNTNLLTEVTGRLSPLDETYKSNY